MKKLTLAYLILIGFSFLAGCNNQKIQNQWIGRPFTIDGKPSDWEGTDQYDLKDLNLMMGTANDENFLYFMFRGDDEKLLRQIQRFGVKIWLNSDGKKKKENGICYRGSPDLLSLPPMTDDGSEPGPPGMEEHVPPMPEHFGANLPAPGMLMLLRGKETQEVSEKSSSGPAAASGVQHGIFCYEFRIPFAPGVDSTKELKLGFEIDGRNKSNFKNRPKVGIRGGIEPDDGPGGDMGGMGGRPPGGGMGGRPGAGMGQRDHPPDGERPDRRGGFEKQELWFTVILAEKK